MQLRIDSIVENEREIAKQFLCPICNFIIQTPCSMKCGHIFCVKCLSRQRGKNYQCPFDGTLFTKTEMSLCNGYKGNDINCYCECRGYGCYWKGTVLQYYSTHVNFCSIMNEFSEEEDNI